MESGITIEKLDKSYPKRYIVSDYVETNLTNISEHPMQIKNLFRIFMLACICTAITFTGFSFAEEDRQTLKHESGIYYTIQKGDTLWDLSQRFYDSPALWPGLWEENDQIPNPHWIYPGKRIRLYYQSGTQQIGLVSKPEVSEVKMPVVIPESKGKAPFYYYAAIESAGFIRKDPVKPKGTIFRSKDDKVMLSLNDLVYIKAAKHTVLYPGSVYTVYRKLESVRGKDINAYFLKFGTQHYLTGMVEIVASEANYFIGRVIRSYRDIRVNDLLMPHQPRSPEITLTESKEGILGQVITNEERDRMFGDHTVAFIDKGKKDGILTGQFYSVFYQGRHGNQFSSKNDELHTPIDFATLLVLLTEENTSTVLITYSEKDLYPTAKIRTPIK